MENASYKKILVAGGEGFVGQNVMEKLKEQGLNAVSLDLATGHDFCDFKKTLKVPVSACLESAFITPPRKWATN